MVFLAGQWQYAAKLWGKAEEEIKTRRSRHSKKERKPEELGVLIVATAWTELS